MNVVSTTIINHSLLSFICPIVGESNVLNLLTIVLRFIPELNKKNSYYNGYSAITKA